MNWLNFPVIAIVTTIFLALGTLFSYFHFNKKLLADIFLLPGILIQFVFLISLWVQLNHPPLRTLGETRLWYSLFMSLIGLVVFKRWGYKWFLAYSNLMAILFLLLNYFHPENYDKTLMPALQSPWFVPHVIVYISGYALLFGSALVSAYGLVKFYLNKFQPEILSLADNLVYLGFSCITLGLIFGALWANEIWGHYWTWDPKEIWALLTWMAYLVYIHQRYYRPEKKIASLWILSLAFVVLLIAWFGINYLPAAQNSVHVYAD